jgi:hypothetical protein
MGRRAAGELVLSEAERTELVALTLRRKTAQAVVAKTLESMPQGATHWSTRTMAREAGVSQTAVSRIWRAVRLQPHRQETFKRRHAECRQRR